MTPTARPSDADVREMARGLSEGGQHKPSTSTRRNIMETRWGMKPPALRRHLMENNDGIR